MKLAEDNRSGERVGYLFLSGYLTSQVVLLRSSGTLFVGLRRAISASRRDYERGQIAILEMPASGYHRPQSERTLMPMNGFDCPLAMWLLVAAQFLGVLSACVARLSEGSRRQAISQSMFLGVLPLVGAATVVAFAIGPGCWLACSGDTGGHGVDRDVRLPKWSGIGDLVSPTELFHQLL